MNQVLLKSMNQVFLKAMNQILPTVMNQVLPKAMNQILPAAMNQILPTAMNQILPAGMNQILPAAMNQVLQPPLTQGAHFNASCVEPWKLGSQLLFGQQFNFRPKLPAQDRMHHIQDPSEERCLLGQNTTCKFLGLSPL